MMKTRKLIASLGFVGASLFAFTGCAETWTFEAVPVGVDDDDAEAGIEGDPTDIECFTIEADHSSGDDEDDKQLGQFCKSRAGLEPDEDNADLDDEGDD